jgi:hypothetical protein
LGVLLAYPVQGPSRWPGAGSAYVRLTIGCDVPRMSLLGIIAALVFILWHPDEAYALPDIICP